MSFPLSFRYSNRAYSLLSLFSRLCEKLYLKAETQQVDRILEQFSRRYWENNPKCVYGGPGE